MYVYQRYKPYQAFVDFYFAINTIQVGTNAIHHHTNAIKLKIYPNNILTPNGDGYNDTWKVKNIEYYPDNSVKVYNVNSVLVRELPNYKGDWDGTTTGGLKLPSGTYYYIITLKSGEALEKGYLTILN